MLEVLWFHRSSLIKRYCMWTSDDVNNQHAERGILLLTRTPISHWKFSVVRFYSPSPLNYPKLRMSMTYCRDDQVINIFNMFGYYSPPKTTTNFRTWFDLPPSFKSAADSRSCRPLTRLTLMNKPNIQLTRSCVLGCG